MTPSIAIISLGCNQVSFIHPFSLCSGAYLHPREEKGMRGTLQRGIMLRMFTHENYSLPMCMYCTECVVTVHNAEIVHMNETCM